MSWIRAADPKAVPDVKLEGGMPRNLLLTLAVDPPAAEALLQAQSTLLPDPAPLSAAQAELIALIVCATNGCAYLVAHRGPRLAAALADEALARAVALDYRESNLTAQDRVLLDYAVALTCEPSERKQEDVDRLREYGFDDRAIVRCTALTASWNAVSRAACAFGLELEPGVEPWSFGLQK
jgi:uncharacterized peroxidase-related enzyme